MESQPQNPENFHPCMYVNPLYSDIPTHADTISMGLPIVYFKGSQVEFSKL